MGGVKVIREGEVYLVLLACCALAFLGLVYVMTYAPIIEQCTGLK